MKKHSEVKWSEVIHKALANYVDRLEIVKSGVIPAETLARKLKEKGFRCFHNRLRQSGRIL
jgi:hypothetical protein